MPAVPTMQDIAIATGNDALIPLIDETSKAHPEFSKIMNKPMKGRRYKTRVRTSLGRVTGSFRDANEGTAAIKHVYENREVETYIVNPNFSADVAVANSHEDGAAAYIATEREGIVEGEFQGLATQIYYGPSNGGNAKGSPGFIDQYDATNMVVDAGGTTASTGSSAWLVRTGLPDVMIRWGENGQMDLTQPQIVQQVDPSDSTKTYPAYWSYMMAFFGLQVGARDALCRIKKLTADSGKGMTDALLAQALAKFPVGKPPNVIFMSRRSRMQLQISRTTVLNGGGSGNPTGAQGTVAPVPTEHAGIPIEVTDAITDTESLSL